MKRQKKGRNVVVVNYLRLSRLVSSLSRLYRRGPPGAIGHTLPHPDEVVSSPHHFYIPRVLRIAEEDRVHLEVQDSLAPRQLDWAMPAIATPIATRPRPLPRREFLDLEPCPPPQPPRRGTQGWPSPLLLQYGVYLPKSPHPLPRPFQYHRPDPRHCFPTSPIHRPQHLPDHLLLPLVRG